MRQVFGFLAAGFGAWLIYSAFTPEYSIEVPEAEIVNGVYDSPENMKVNPDDFESGADVDFDLSAYFEDLFNRVSAFTETEINHFFDVWGQ